MLRFAVLVLALATAQVDGTGLVDNPIEGDAIRYLDGQWTASTTFATCSYLQDTDFDAGSIGETVAARTAEECCQACWVTESCAASVWYGECWFKTQDQLSRKSNHPGRTACVKESGGSNFSINAQVPGDLVSDLHAAGVIGNPLYELNFLNSSIWDHHAWTYSTTFAAPAADSLLVFDGVKMGARVKVNGVVLGQVTDQFLRYRFDLRVHDLKPDSNLLEVAFDRDITCDGRWMACTGGWDWAPYTNTKQEGAQTFTKGVWKSVYIVSAGTAAIEHFVPHVFYKGDYPLEPLQEGAHAGFEVRTRVHLLARAAASGTLRVVGAWGKAVSKKVSLPAGNTSVSVTLDAAADEVNLWWPAGVGAQPLYTIKATFVPDTQGAAPVSASREIGFRSAVLSTGNDTDPEYVRKASTEEGTGSHGMILRVNGAVIFSKGANMIPMEELEGWMDADAHTLLVRSAVQGGMNTLRVWGGGMFLPDAWYDECDRLGILVYHDMQYAQQGHSPKATATQDDELRHMIRRLSHHASIVIWDGCNECNVDMTGPTAIYASFVMTVVAEEDQSRVVWPSCPAKGWTSGVHKLTQLPNGNKLVTPKGGRAIETHGAYQHGAGFPAVNGARKLEMFASNIPLNLSPTRTGTSLQNVFGSEFGAVVMSSFESMSPTLDPKHWALHAGQPDDTCTGGFASVCHGPNVMAQRNYPCDNIIYVYFGQRGQDLNKTGEQSFKKQLYQCMIGQALEVKQDIEHRRAGNMFGILVWQYNEIWPTGGWGSIEYGNPLFPGQVIGGRWKPLQYWYRSSVFADVMATCGQKGWCYVKNDAPRRFVGTLTLQATSFASGEVNTLLSKHVDLPAGAGVTQWLHSDGVAALDGNASALEAIVSDEAGAEVSRNVVALATPERMRLKDAKVTVSAAREADGALVAEVRAEAVAMYVTLTTLAHGRFEDNAFLLRPPGRRVKFVQAELSPHSEEEATRVFKASLRVEDVSAYRDDFAGLEDEEVIV